MRASAPGTTPLDFYLTWRGLRIDQDPSTNSYLLTLRHSQVLSPITLVIAAPPTSTALTPWGEIGVDLLSGGAGAAVLDGLGILGTANPAITTQSFFPTFTFGVGNIPPVGGLQLVAQGFAIDWNRFPGDDAVLISNTVSFVLP